MSVVLGVVCVFVSMRLYIGGGTWFWRCLHGSRERREREREGTLWKSEECCSVSSSDSLECKPNLISYNTIDTSTYNLVNLVLN